MFYAFFPCNHSPATSLGDHFASGLSLKTPSIVKAIENNVTSNFENLFYVPEQFKGNGILFPTASEGFFHSCVAAKKLKQRAHPTLSDKFVGYTTTMCNIAVEKAISFANLVVRKVPMERKGLAD